jgi:hypothetical protein
MGSADTASSSAAVPASLPPIAPVLASDDAARLRAARYLQQFWRTRTTLRRTVHLLNVIRLASRVRPEKGMLRRSISTAQRHSLSIISARLLPPPPPHKIKRWSLVQAGAIPAAWEPRPRSALRAPGFSARALLPTHPPPAPRMPSPSTHLSL